MTKPKLTFKYKLKIFLTVDLNLTSQGEMIKIRDRSNILLLLGKKETKLF